MSNYLKKLFFLKRTYKITFFLIIDLILSSFSLWLSFNIRLIDAPAWRGEFFNPLKIDIWLYLIVFMIFILIQLNFKSYYQLSRFFSIASINNLIRNFFILFILLYFIRSFFLENFFFPQSITIIYPIIFFFISLFKNTIFYNLYHYIRDSLKSDNRRVLFYDFKNKTNNYLQSYIKPNFLVLGIVGLSNTNLKIYNKKFTLIDESEIEKFIKFNKITDIIVSKKSNYKNKIFYFNKFLKFNVRVLFLDDIYNAKDLSSSNKIFEPKVDDVIKKNEFEVTKDQFTQKNIKGKVILVAGGAGSIGSVLVERLIKLSPKKIIIVDKDEFNIFNLKKKLDNTKNILFKLSDTSNKFFLEKIFKKFKPHIVYNAAAYKHVTIVEENIQYAILNNLNTAKNICELSIKYNSKISLLVSTDKAVDPKNLMGMSKNLCEKIYQSYSILKRSDQKFIIVRFGNVAGSKGSVLPYFQKLIHLRESLPVTSKKASRFLMSIREASDLIIKASIIGINSKIYVLDMGSPINIYNLACNLIKFNGLSIKNKNNPAGDIEIRFVGLSKGEKLHEKLSNKNKLIKTGYDKILLCDEMKINLRFRVKLNQFMKIIRLNSNEILLKKKLKDFL